VKRVSYPLSYWRDIGRFNSEIAEGGIDIPVGSAPVRDQLSREELARAEQRYRVARDYWLFTRPPVNAATPATDVSCCWYGGAPRAGQRAVGFGELVADTYLAGFDGARPQSATFDRRTFYYRYLNRVPGVTAGRLAVIREVVTWPDPEDAASVGDRIDWEDPSQRPSQQDADDFYRFLGVGASGVCRVTQAA
jgi:hypothetical protein